MRKNWYEIMNPKPDYITQYDENQENTRKTDIQSEIYIV